MKKMMMTRVKLITLSMFAVLFSFASSAQTGITGTLNVCQGGTTPLSDTARGGTWSSGNTSIATVSPSTGIVAGIAAGTVTIYYTTVSGSDSASVTVNPLPTAYAITGGGAYCSGGSGSFIGLANTQTGVSYQLYCTISVGSPVIGFGGSITFGPQTVAGSYYVVATNITTACSATMTGTTTVSVNPLPNAYTVTGGGGYCSGGTGVPVGISNSDIGTNYSLFQGATFKGIHPGTGSLFNFGPQTTGGAYTIMATSTATGCVRNMTGSVSVSVNPLPAAISGTANLCTGVPVTFTDAAGGGTWSSSSTGVAVVGGSTGTVVGTGPGTSAISYTLGTGCSMSFFITVNALPTAITGLSSVCAGSTDTLGDATPGGTWSCGSTGIATVSPGGIVAGTTTGTANISYTLSGCTVSKIVSVSTTPVAYTVTGSGSFCPGSAGVDVRLSNSDNGINYELYYGSTPIGTPLAGVDSMLDFGFQSTAGTYTVKAVTSSGCTSIMNGSAVITALPNPTAFTVTGGASYCPGSTGPHIELAGSQTGATYQLMLSGAPASGIYAGTGSIIDFGAHTATGIYTVVATLNPCTVSMTGSASVSQYPLPAVFTVSGSGSYCAGGTVLPITVNGSQHSTIYRLYNGTSLVDSVAGTGSAINFGGISSSGTFTVVAVDTTTTCVSNMAGSAYIIINALPTVFSVTGGGGYCAGGSGANVGLSSSVPGIDYQLYYSGTGSVVTSRTGTGSAISFGPQVAGGVYTAKASDITTSCISNMAGSATVTITPTVTPTVAISSLPGDTVCAGDAVAFTATPFYGGLSPTYTWFVNGLATGPGTGYTYVPANGDVVSVKMISSATCAVPDTVTQAVRITVNPHPVISGPTSVCLGSTIVYTSLTGSTWYSIDPTIATIGTVGGTAGVLLPLSAGTTSITSSLSGCSSSIVVTVNALPAVSLSSVASCGGVSTLSAGGAVSYTWSPSAGLSCSTCTITDANPGSTTIYTVTGTDATGCSDTATISVDANRISGYISCGSPLTSFKVWLIQYDPIDTLVVSEDSTLSCMATGGPYYQFNDVPPGNYEVRAVLQGQPSADTQYVPTYSLYYTNWSSATGVTHTNATDTMHIDMVRGILSPGRGFIGGYISSGAGKGTSGFVPAPGVLVFLKDAFSNNVLSYTYTNNAGDYAFTNIAYDNYVVYPEDFGFGTTPSATVMLDSASDSAKNVDFKIFTTSRIIVPVNTTGVNTITEKNSIIVYPNPTQGGINIRWNSQARGNAQIIISDITGREVFRSSADMNATSEAQVNPELQSGIYLLSIISDNVSYSGKLIISR